MAAARDTLSSLFEAIKNQDEVGVEAFLSANPSWVGRTLKGCTLLDAAIHWHAQSPCKRAVSLRIIIYLLESGANVNQLSACFDVMDGSETPLIAATRKCASTEVVACLIKAGARLDVVDGVAQQSALSYACIVPPSDPRATTALEIAKLLLEHGAEVNGAPGERTPPLHLAVNQGDNLMMVKLLVSYGADVNAADSDFRVPLHKVKDTRVAEFLVNNGACLMPQTRHWLQPIEEILASCDRQLAPHQMQIVRLMIRHGASLNVKVIPEVCWFPYIENIQLLVDSGALQLHPPWRERGVCGPATQRSQHQTSHFRKCIADEFDRQRQLRRFPNPFWHLHELLTCLPAEKYDFLKYSMSNPTSLQRLCISEIRHWLFLRSKGRSILEMVYTLPGPANLLHMIALRNICGNNST